MSSKRSSAAARSEEQPESPRAIGGEPVVQSSGFVRALHGHPVVTGQKTTLRAVRPGTRRLDDGQGR